MDYINTTSFEGIVPVVDFPVVDIPVDEDSAIGFTVWCTIA